MSFYNFTNPFQDVNSIPEMYRANQHLQGLFQTDGSYLRPLIDPIMLWIIDTLRKDYDVPLEAIEVGSPTELPMSRIDQAKADLIIYDDRFINSAGNFYVAFILVEVRDLGRNFGGTVGKGNLDFYERLSTSMSVFPSARYAILTSGTSTLIYRRGPEYPLLEEIADLPQYQSVREASEHNPYKVVLNQDEPDGIQTGLRTLTKDIFRKVLGDIHSGCHAILRDIEGLQPQEAVEAIVKFLFAKWYDEQATIELAKRTSEEKSYVFGVSPRTDPERLVMQVRETFQQAKEWEKALANRNGKSEKGNYLAFTDHDELAYRPLTTQRIVENLQPWSLRRSPASVKGSVFEDFLSQTFRDDLGQFFTPTPVIQLMVGMLQPTINDFIGDPACGSARMLTHALDYVRQEEYKRAILDNNGLTQGTHPEEPTEAFLQFRDTQLFGADISHSAMRLARINTLMNGAQYINLKVMDTLAPLRSITNGVMKGLPAYPGFYPGGLTMIITNPPFGSKVTDPHILQDFASRDGVTRKKGAKTNSISQEVAFLNRCLEFLAPRGKLAIVLPDGLLANDSMQFVRDWILSHARLKAIISLPHATFSPFGSSVKTSLVILEKREIPLALVDQTEVSQKGILSDDEDYDVYMARIDDIGYDASGRRSVSQEETQEPPEIGDIIESFKRKIRW
jgi:type I restriction enzyme M protein